MKDDAKAAAYFKSASDLGQYYASNELANCYYEGVGVAKNLRTAFSRRLLITRTQKAT